MELNETSLPNVMPRNPDLLPRFRHARTFPALTNRTKYQPFLNYRLLHNQ